MLTRRGQTLLVAAVGLWAASRAFGVPELAMAAVAVLAATILAIVYTTVTSARITATRVVHPSRLFFDAEASVELRIRNEGRWPTAILQVEDSVPRILGAGARFVLAPMGRGAAVTMRYALAGRQRGRFEIGPLEVRLRDPFGIAARRERFHRRDEVVVYPPIWRLSASVPLGGVQGPGGEGRPRPQATGEDLATVREYVRGDDLRKVHWRSTAHRGKLMVRQDESPQNPAAAIVLDRRAPVHRGTGPESSFEVAVATAASVAYHLSERSYGVTLLTEPVAAAPRAVPWQLALEQLAVLTPGPAGDLPALWQQLAGATFGGGLLVAVVAVPDPALLRQMVRAGRGVPQRVALLVDTDGFAGRHRHRPESERVADALRAAEWRVTVVRPGDRIDERWQELALHRQVRLGAAR